MDKQWIVCSGMGATYRGAFATLEEALRFVATQIVRPKGARNFEWRCQMDRDGVVDYYVWSAPTRPETREEMEAKFDRGEMGQTTARQRRRIIRDWLSIGVVTDDFEGAAEWVEFPSGPVSSVSISTLVRERAYLARSDQAGNDNAARRLELSVLLAN